MMAARDTASKQADDLMKPVLRMFKRQATDAIRSAQAEIKNILRVKYDAPEAARPQGLPAPRLQLRWEATPDGRYERTCHYELVFPLQEHDIRNDAKTGFGVIELGRTRSSGGRDSWDDVADRAPFRDGAHAQWDTKHFGNLPIFVIAPDGSCASMRVQAPEPNPLHPSPHSPAPGSDPGRGQL